MMTTTQTVSHTRHLTVSSGRAFTDSSQWGYRACVESDGTVSVYDDVAGHYTTCHALTPRQIARIRREAR